MSLRSFRDSPVTITFMFYKIQTSLRINECYDLLPEEMPLPTKLFIQFLGVHGFPETFKFVDPSVKPWLPE